MASNALFFFSGFNDVLVWNVASVYLPFGLLTLPPFVVIGIYRSVRKRQVHANLFLIWLVATIPLFFLFPLNINRVNAIFIPLIALNAIGISGLYDWIGEKVMKMAVLSLVLVALIVYNSDFCLYYFNNYNNDIKSSSNAGFDMALMQARFSASTKEPIYVSDKVNTNYIYTLFFLKADPIDFQKHSRIYINHGAYIVINYRKYYFYPNEPQITSYFSSLVCWYLEA